jgi:deazaflavin-dependent oxidoreductase (nitroreductase family)
MNILNLLKKIGNPFVTALLRSPLHGVISRNTALITVTGRRSGKRYTTPVNYVRDNDMLIVVSQADRNWWKNLGGGAPVTFELCGQRLNGYAESFKSPEAVGEGLIYLIRRFPKFRTLYHISLTSDGTPAQTEEFTQLTQQKVIVIINDLVSEQGVKTGAAEARTAYTRK